MGRYGIDPKRYHAAGIGYKGTSDSVVSQIVAFRSAEGLPFAERKATIQQSETLLRNRSKDVAVQARFLGKNPADPLGLGRCIDLPIRAMVRPVFRLRVDSE